MGSKCGASSRKKPVVKNDEAFNDNNHPMIQEVPFSEQEKEEESYDRKSMRLRINHSMHESSLVLVNDRKEIKPADNSVEGKINLEELVTITKENIKTIYDIDPNIVGKNTFYLLFFSKFMYIISSWKFRPVEKSNSEKLPFQDFRH